MTCCTYKQITNRSQSKIKIVNERPEETNRYRVLITLKEKTESEEAGRICNAIAHAYSDLQKLRSKGSSAKFWDDIRTHFIDFIRSEERIKYVDYVRKAQLEPIPEK